MTHQASEPGSTHVHGCGADWQSLLIGRDCCGAIVTHVQSHAEGMHTHTAIPMNVVVAAAAMGDGFNGLDLMRA